MIVCHCAAVTDTAIERLIDEGARSVAEIARRCGAGRCCAPCRDEITALLYAANVSEDTQRSIGSSTLPDRLPLALESGGITRSDA